MIDTTSKNEQEARRAFYEASRDKPGAAIRGIARNSQIDHECEALQKLVYEARDVFNQIIDKITPVLSEPPETKPADDIPIQALCPLGERIRTTRCDCERLVKTLKRVLERIEL